MLNKRGGGVMDPRDHWLRGLSVVVKGTPHPNQHGY